MGGGGSSGQFEIKDMRSESPLNAEIVTDSSSFVVTSGAHL
jgi:hypothetical protein